MWKESWKSYHSNHKRLCWLMLQIIKMIEQTTEHPQRFDEGGEIILPFSIIGESSKRLNVID
jgi:hypothetical protein